MKPTPSSLLLFSLLWVGLVSSHDGLAETELAEVLATHEELRYFCGFTWEDCTKACRDNYNDCKQDLACGQPITAEEISEIGRQEGFQASLRSLGSIILDSDLPGAQVNIGLSRGHDLCLTIVGLRQYESGFWIFKSKFWKFASQLTFRLNREGGRIENLSFPSGQSSSGQGISRPWTTESPTTSERILYISDSWDDLTTISEPGEPVQVPGSVSMPEAKQALVEEGWSVTRPFFNEQGWLVGSPVRLTLWQGVCKIRTDATCSGTQAGAESSDGFRFFERNGRILILRFDPSSAITGTWLYEASRSDSSATVERKLTLWTEDSRTRIETGSYLLHRFGLTRWTEAANSRSYFERSGASAAYSGLGGGQSADWRSSDGEYRYQLAIHDSGDFSVARFSDNGLDQVSHFRGLEGTVTYLPPQPPVVDSLSVSPARQYFGSPLKIEVHSRSSISSVQIAVNGDTYGLKNSEPGVWTTSIKPAWFRNHIRVTLANESGTASQTATVWYYPAHLIGGSLLVILGTLVYLWYSRRQRFLEQQHRQAARQQRKQAFLEELAQLDHFLENEFYDDAEEFLENLRKQYPGQRTTIDQAAQRVAMARHHADREHLQKLSHSLEDLASRIDSPTGHLDLGSTKKKGENK